MTSRRGLVSGRRGDGRWCMTPEIWQETLRILDRRALSEADLKLKLRNAGFADDDISEAVARATALGCCDDFALAGWRARACAEGNHGLRRIKENLRKSHVSEAALEAALAEQAGDEPARAVRACQYKLRCLARESDSGRKREKVLRFLLARGFSMDIALTTVNEALSGEAGDF